ncbi:MAG: o-succinylbenzoate--CoA ligase [Thermomicrobiales bacterium]|nr:o-succinylbenzoate--CoA ligase [Thermomicrobiales bacterium]
MTDGLTTDWLDRRARAHPNRLALSFADRAWTFAELDRAVAMAAGALRLHDVGSGSRVALLAGNSAGTVIAIHALLRLGAAIVPLNTRLTPAELAWQAADAEAALLLHDADHADAAAAVGDRPTVHFGENGPAERGAAPVAGGTIDLGRPQTIVYTSGTTGRPKGAVLTAGNWWWGAAGSALHLGHHRDDRWLAALPLFHVGGLAILVRSVIGGVPVSLQAGFDPERMARAFVADNISLVSVVPAMLPPLFEALAKMRRPHRLRLMLTGGSPATEPLLREALARGLPVAPTYGLTETASQVATLLPDDIPGHSGSSGTALPQTELRIERDGQIVPPGGEGDIVVRGPTVMRGYLGQAPLARDGWLHTGDIGRLDAGGYLTVLDRRGDLIVSGGENIYPAEVEAALLAMPGVAEAAVVSAPDARWGAIPVAFVVARPGASPTDEEIERVLATRLAGYKRPKRIEWVDRLPRTASGKVLRRALRERLQPPL